MCMGIQNITLGGLSVYSAIQAIILFINLIWPELLKEKHHNIVFTARTVQVHNLRTSCEMNSVRKSFQGLGN